MDYSQITVLIITCYNEHYKLRRKKQLETVKLLKEAGFTVYYLLGFDDNSFDNQYKIIKNFDNDCDALVVPILECYENLSIKSYLGFVYFLNTPCGGILKIDDDTIITSSIFTGFIKYMYEFRNVDYAGAKSVNFEKRTDTHIQNKTLKSNYLSSMISIIPTPLLYFAGTCYWISRKFMIYIRRDNLKNISEDLAIGIIAKENKELKTLVFPPEICKHIILGSICNSIKSGRLVMPVLRGGVCNRVFQILSAIQFASLNNFTCVINYNLMADAKHQSNDETFDIIQRIFPTIPVIYNTINAKDTYVFNEEFGGLKYEFIKSDDSKQHLVLKGFFQAYQYIDKLNIYNYLNIGGIPSSTIKDEDNPASYYFLHIRLGDYLIYKWHFIDLTNYYNTCIRKILERDPVNNINILVFSNEHTELFHEKFKKLPQHNRINYIIQDPNDPPEKVLNIMSLCQGGAICANSSLSLLGAILLYEKYKRDKAILEEHVTVGKHLAQYLRKPQIFMPSKWIEFIESYNESNTKDVYPPWAEVISIN